MKGIVFDLDGTLVRGDQAVPGAVAAVGALRARGIRVAYCTQDSVKAPATIAEKLDRLGFGAAPEDIISTGWVAAAYLAERYGSEPVYMIGAPELRRIFSARGVNVAADHDAKGARAVFVARDPGFSAATITAACQAIWNGAALFGVGYDRVLPLAGRHAPGTGAVLKAIEYATHKRAHILGKPALELAAAALARLQSRPDETVIVGDQIDADIRMGKAAGCRTVLVLSGGTTAERARRVPARWRPDAVLADVGRLPEWIENGGGRP